VENIKVRIRRLTGIIEDGRRCRRKKKKKRREQESFLNNKRDKPGNIDEEE